MNNSIENAGVKVGGVFTFQHIRDGKVIWEEQQHNLVVNQGLVYMINAALGAIVGGAPTPFTNLYIGLARANRSWTATDIASTIHSVSTEMELYDEAARPAWALQALATTGSIQVTNTGAEATYTISDLTSLGGSADIYGAFIISASAKNGGSDAAATLLCGSNFTAPRTLYQADVFKVGYTFSAADDGV